MTYVSKEELDKIQGMNAEFSKAKMALGELELNKQGILNQNADSKIRSRLSNKFTNRRSNTKTIKWLK